MQLGLLNEELDLDFRDIRLNCIFFLTTLFDHCKYFKMWSILEKQRFCFSKDCICCIVVISVTFFTKSISRMTIWVTIGSMIIALSSKWMWHQFQPGILAYTLTESIKMQSQYLKFNLILFYFTSLHCDIKHAYLSSSITMLIYHLDNQCVCPFQKREEFV